MKQFVFGAGVYARNLIAHLMLKGQQIDGIFVTDTNVNPKKVMGIDVLSKQELFALKNAICVYIGVSELFRYDVIKELNSINNVYVNYDKPMPIEKKYYPNVSNEKFISVWYLYITDRGLDWKNLNTYDEKLQWLKLYDQTSIKTRLSDKYLVREYVSEIVGNEYLIPIYGVYDAFQDIDVNELPNQFVLKCNHGSGYNVIVKDKQSCDWEAMGHCFDRWMKTDYSDQFGMELQYKNIKRKIIAEKLLYDEDGKELMDYKIFVFDGIARYVQVDIDRFSNHRRNIYTREWQYIPCSIGYPNAPDHKVEKPDKLMEMLYVAERLGKNFLHVRVDLYFFEGSIYFGELTFTHGSGIEEFYPEEFGYELGRWIHIKKEGLI